MTRTAKTGRMTTAIERIFVALKHSSSSFFIYPEFSGGQANEDANFAWIEVSMHMF